MSDSGEEDELPPLQCPHCDEMEFWKAGAGVTSHLVFTHGASKSEATEFNDRLSRALDRYNLSKKKEELSESQIQRIWKEKHGSEFVHLFEEVAVGKYIGSTGQPKYADLVGVRSHIPDASDLFNLSAGEKWLKDQGWKQSSSTEKFREVIKSHEEDVLEVEIYEVKKKLNAKSIGQILSYSHVLPQEYGTLDTQVMVAKKGIVFGETDLFYKQVAENQFIDLSHISRRYSDRKDL